MQEAGREGSPITVTARFGPISHNGWDNRDRFWFIDLSASEVHYPVVIALTWSGIKDGWFPAWALKLHSSIGLLPSHLSPEIEEDVFQEPTRCVEVARTPPPELDHLYEAKLSYDPGSGALSLEVKDTTVGERVYVGGFRIKPYSGKLYAGAGELTQRQDVGNGTEARCVMPATYIAMEESFIPFEATWEFVERVEGGSISFIPVSGDTISQQSRDLFVRLHLPEAGLSGKFSFVIGDGQKEIMAIDILQTGEEVVLPLPLSRLNVGALTFKLLYRDPRGNVRILTSREVQLVSGFVHYTMEIENRVGEILRGNVVLNSDGEMDNVRFRLTARILEAGPEEWVEIKDETVLEKAFPRISEEAETIPFQVRLPIPANSPAALVRVCLEGSVEPPAGIGRCEGLTETDFLVTNRTLINARDAWGNRDYSFDGSISREVLENYLSRALTVAFIGDTGEYASRYRMDNVRMVVNTGAKFIGRAAGTWGTPGDDEEHFRVAKETADLIHQADPTIITQAAIFEIVDRDVKKIPVPGWVFEEFGLKPETRGFNYEDMLYSDGRFVNHWGDGASVPDMSKLETRMWFYYRARRYIDSGYEAIHFGQVHLMDQNDPGHVCWQDLLGRVRAYAARHARRHLVLCDAHTHGVVEDGRLLFDFHAYPLRIAEVPGKPEEGCLVMGRIDSIYGRSKGGITPSGWPAESLPYLVEVDNYGLGPRPGESCGEWWTWGYDEIVWFARQDEVYRNEWLRYAWDWVRKHDPNGWFQMPAMRCLAAPVNGRNYYYANTRSVANPDGFNQEETIKQIWGNE